MKGKIAPMNSGYFKYEGWLYGLAFFLAVALRFIGLGDTALTDSEATLALQALEIARGGHSQLAPQPAYILLTSLLFAVTESNNFLARFLPALAGSALVFAPLFFRDRIKPRPAVILSILLALDPTLVAMSRTAGGTILAVTFLVVAVGCWMDKRNIATGIFAALALLSGPALWAGILGIALAWIFLRGAKPSAAAEQLAMGDSESSIVNRQSVIVNQESPVSNLQSQSSNPKFLIAFLATLLLCGTLFFIAPNGISAALASIPAYFSGWVAQTDVTPARMLLAFLFYEPLGILLAALAIVRAMRADGKRAKRLTLWLGMALLLAVFYRQPAGLAWVALPMLTLAALELSRAFDVQREEYLEVGVVILAILILLVYISFTVSNLALNPFGAPATLPLIGTVNNPPLAVLVSSLVILFVCIALVALGWSARIARLGATFALSAFIGLYTIAAAWGVSGLRYPDGFELLTTDPKPAQADLLFASVNDISEFSLGHDQSQPVLIVGIDSPALEWTLRNHSVEVVSTLDPQTAPPIFLTPVMDDPGLPSAYRGQDFTWRIQPQWEFVQSADWISWFVFRNLPRETETVILWARDDLFPDARQGGQP